MPPSTTFPSTGPTTPPSPNQDPQPRPPSPALTPLFPPHPLAPASHTRPDHRAPYSAHLRATHPHLWNTGAGDDGVPPNPVAAAIKATAEYLRTHTPTAECECATPPLPLSPPYVAPVERPGNVRYDPGRGGWIARGEGKGKGKGKGLVKRVAFKLEAEVLGGEQEKKKTQGGGEKGEAEGAERKGGIVGLIGQTGKRREAKKAAGVE